MKISDKIYRMLEQPGESIICEKRAVPETSQNRALINAHACNLYHLILMTTCCCMMISASILSCTDHAIENPETACVRTDGSPRYFPCEFKIVKAEFTKFYIGDVIATVTPENRKVTLPVKFAFVNIRPSTGYADVTYKVILYIKRISNPSISSSNQYVIPYLTSVVSELDASVSAYRFTPAYPPLSNNISIAVGDTFRIAMDASYHVKEDLEPTTGKPVYSKPSGVIAYLIYNMKTAAALAAPPNNYQNVLDLAESHIIIEPTFVE